MSKWKSVKSVDLTYYQKNRGVILNRAKDYYQNHKGRSREQARNKYRKLSEEKNNRNMSEEKKQRLKEYQKVIERQKSLNIIMNKIVF